MVDVAFGFALAVAGRLVALVIVWIRERHRSARAAEMAQHLPSGSRYIEGTTYVMIEVGRIDQDLGQGKGAPS